MYYGKPILKESIYIQYIYIHWWTLTSITGAQQTHSVGTYTKNNNSSLTENHYSLDYLGDS